MRYILPILLLLSASPLAAWERCYSRDINGLMFEDNDCDGIWDEGERYKLICRGIESDRIFEDVNCDGFKGPEDLYYATEPPQLVPKILSRWGESFIFPFLKEWTRHLRNSRIVQSAPRSWQKSTPMAALNSYTWDRIWLAPYRAVLSYRFGR